MAASACWKLARLRTLLALDPNPTPPFAQVYDNTLSPLPFTIAVNEVLVPLQTELPEPKLVMVGKSFMANTALALVTLPHPLVAINE